MLEFCSDTCNNEYVRYADTAICEKYWVKHLEEERYSNAGKEKKVKLKKVKKKVKWKVIKGKNKIKFVKRVENIKIRL